MKTNLVLFALFLSSMALSQTRNAIFGVYRGLSSPNVSCTATLLEQRPFNGVAVLIDQNPYLYVNTAEIMAVLAGSASRATLNSMESNRQGHVELFMDSKKNITEIHTTFNGSTAVCSKIFQIRRQDD